MATHFLGPVLGVGDAEAPSNRGWYANKPHESAPDYVVYFNDFAVNTDYQATDWTVTETDATNATQAVSTSYLNGALLLTNSNTEDDVVQLQSNRLSWRLTAGKNVWFETRFQLDNVGQNDGFVGLATTDITILGGTTDSIGFRWADASAAVEAITEDNTSETTTAAVATLVAATDVTLGWHWDGKSRVDFYVDKVLKATHTANIEQTNRLALTVTLQAGAAVTDIMSLDYIYICQER